MQRSTTRTRLRVPLVLVLAAVLALPVTAARAQASCSDSASADYATYDCKVARLRARHFVVVAVVDTGINPYHVDFRLPAGDDREEVPPWEYIDGYPRDASPLALSLDAAPWANAFKRDRATWDSVQRYRLYHVPGTKIIGGYATEDDHAGGVRPILDDDGTGHGTAAASVAAGAVHGSSTDTEVLVVAVEGMNTEALAWAAQQPWIDIVTNSWGYTTLTLDTTSGEDKVTREAVEGGKSVLFAAGNGLLNGPGCLRDQNLLSPRAGPSWILTVGAVSSANGQSTCWHSLPVDVSSYGTSWPAAGDRTISGERSFSGTSNATPLVAGVLAGQVLAARRLLDDPREGPHDGALAAAPSDVARPQVGPLADGRLTNAEAEAVVLKTARPVAFNAQDLPKDPFVLPTTDAYYLYQGYGVVNAESKARALRVLAGEDAMPDRSDVDQWMALKDRVADAVWGD